MKTDLFLVHGWGMNAACWQPLLETAPPHWQVIAPDLPGHGQNSRQCPDRLDALARQLLEAAPGQAIWCGWSLGALLALRAARLAPDRIAGLVLLAPTPRFVAGPDWPAGMDRAVFADFAAAVNADLESGWRRFVLLTLTGDPQARERARSLTAALRTRGLPSAQAAQAGLQILADSDLRQDLPPAHLPVRLMCGSEDILCSPAAAQWLNRQRGWPLAQVATGHAPHLTAPQAVWHLIEEIAHAGSPA